MKQLASAKRYKSAMYLERSPKPQTGAGLPLAIFIVTVLSLIVLGMSQLQQSSGKAISLQIQSQRAFFAAESGAQVVLAAIMPEDVETEVSCSAPLSLPVSISFSAEGLGGCVASLSCNDVNSPLVTIESIGECGGGVELASRTVRVRVQ